MNTHYKIVSFFLFMAIASCVNIPKGVLPMDKMENILVDIHTAEAITDQYYSEYGTIEQKQRVAAEMLKKNGVTKAEFDSSLIFYGSRLDLYMKIYQNVSKRFNDKKDMLTDDVLTFERSLLTPYGDSVDIWNRGSQLILTPGFIASNYHEIKVDSNFKRNDKLVLNFKINNAPIDSTSYLLAILGKSNSSEFVNATSGNFFKKGWNTLEISDTLFNNNDNIFVTYSFISRNNKEPGMYIDSISLLKYHEPKKEITADSLISDSLSVNSVIDSLGNVIKSAGVENDSALINKNKVALDKK